MKLNGEVKKVNERTEADIKATKERMKKLRISGRMTQQELADKLRYELETIKKAENGKRDISKNVLTAYQDHFGVSRDYLLWGKKLDNEEIPAKNYLDIFQTFPRDEQKKLVVWYILNND